MRVAGLDIDCEILRYHFTKDANKYVVGIIFCIHILPPSCRDRREEYKLASCTSS